MRKLLIGIGVVVLLPILAGAVLLLEAHAELRRLEAPLPSEGERAEFRSGATGPVSIAWIESGQQRRSDGRMSTTGSFLLEWPDGRAFLIDAGMTSAGMRAFAEVFEEAMDAGPVRTSGSAGAQLGDRARRLVGIGFTHLHHDHTEGVSELCSARSGARLPMLQLPDQADRGNYTTDPGREYLVDAPCLEGVRLDPSGRGAAYHPVPELPGLVAFAAGGHTPGSTVFVARLPDRVVYFAGDIANEHARLLANEGKGFVYSYLMVPENTGRLDELRRWLGDRHAEPDTFVVVSHDLEGMAEARISLPPALDAER